MIATDVDRRIDAIEFLSFDAGQLDAESNGHRVPLG